MSNTGDITQTNSEQRYYPDDAETLPANLENFSTFISHELRTPLASITGVLGLLQAGHLGPLSEEGHSFLNIAISGVDRLMRLTQAIERNLTDTMPFLSKLEMKSFQLENDLIRAINQQDFKLFYQPIISIKDNQTIGFEVIPRWLHSQDGWLDSAIFLPLAERLGLLEKFTLWQLERVGEQLKIWQQKFPSRSPLFLSINFSASQLLQPNLISIIQHSLQTSSISPNSLRLEIIEVALIQDYKLVLDVIANLKVIGIQCYISNFSIHYSALVSLRELSINTLKIKCSLLRLKTWKLSKTILLAAENLGLDTIVEGVESLEDLEFLKSLGCKQAQGCFFSKPVYPETACVFLLPFSSKY